MFERNEMDERVEPESADRCDRVIQRRIIMNINLLK